MARTPPAPAIPDSLAGPQPAVRENPSRCLYCRSALAPPQGAAVRCGSCNNVNLKVDQQSHWTLSPRAVATQRILRTAGTVALAFATWRLMTADTGTTETGLKIFVLMGMLIPTVLWWDLCGLRTRKVSRSRFEVIVPAAFLVVSVFPISWALFHALWGQSPDLWGAFVESLGLLIYAQPFAFASWWLVRSMRWLQRQEMETFHAPLSPSEAADAAQATRPAAAPPASDSRAVRAVRAAQGLVNARPSSSYKKGVRSKRSTSCLHCFAPLPPMEGASQSCPVCMRTTRKVDQAVFWTRHESMVDRERLVKALIASLLVIAVAVIYLNVEALSRDSMWGAPTAIAVAATVAALAWDLAGMITRHRSMLRLELILPFGVGFFGIGAVIFGRIAMTGKRSFQRGTVRDSLDIPWTFGIPFLIAGLILYVMLRWFDDWRDETRARIGKELG